MYDIWVGFNRSVKHHKLMNKLTLNESVIGSYFSVHAKLNQTAFTIERSHSKQIMRLIVLSCMSSVVSIFSDSRPVQV